MSISLRSTKRAEKGPLDSFAGRCAAGLDALYRTARASSRAEPKILYTESIRYIIRMLAVLISAQRINENKSSTEMLHQALHAINNDLDNPSESNNQLFEDSLRAVHDTSGFGIFATNETDLGPDAFRITVQALLRPHPDALIEHIYFQTMPLSWLGSVYQHLLTFQPNETGDALEPSRSHRKNRGVFFTPQSLVSYIIEGVLTPLTESCLATLDSASTCISAIKILDPAMGGGDFLSCAVDFLSENASDLRAELAAGCVYGVDVDPGAVEVARFCVWAASGFADSISNQINSHLICGNALGAHHEDEPPFNWGSSFPEAFAAGGFDAVIGNPPYIASKNGLSSPHAAGQSDTYLLFLSTIMDNVLVRPGGLLSMVLPDPMLVRENAAVIRRKLTSDWTILSLLHISGAFSDALVANVVPICRNVPESEPVLIASRIERAADRRSFLLRPRRTALDLAHPVRLETVTAQRRCELLYLLEQGAFGDIIRRIHGDSIALTNYQEPFVPLRKLNAKEIYRGEEVGKAAIIGESGDMPILLGGQSIQPYEITWEGRRINRSWVRKPIERYLSSKILIQKSSPRIIAALDQVTKTHPGYVFPQSVYAIELSDEGMDPHYLLCILNSRVINEYIWRTVSGYKLLQPQLELEDIRALPIRRVNFTTHHSERESDLARGISIFESESLRIGESAPFPELANFVVACLTGYPEKSDVVHDILVHLGKTMVDLARKNRISPDTETTRRIETIRSAIETIIWRLYSSEPAQMSLPW